MTGAVFLASATAMHISATYAAPRGITTGGPSHVTLLRRSLTLVPRTCRLGLPPALKFASIAVTLEQQPLGKQISTI